MKLNFSKGLFVAFSILSLLICCWTLYINTREIIGRTQGDYTFFSQRGNLSDKEAIWYCITWIFILFILLTLVIYNILKKRNKATLINCILFWLVTIASFFIDTLFYSKLP